MLLVYVTGADSLRSFARNLKAAGQGGLVRRLRSQVHQLAAPIVAEVRREVMAYPSRGSKHRGLRAAVAAAVTSSTRTTGTVGIRILISRGRLPEEWKTMPDNLENGWRHPLFGNKSRWYPQEGRPFFWVTIRRHYPRFNAACWRAINQTLDSLD